MRKPVSLLIVAAVLLVVAWRGGPGPARATQQPDPIIVVESTASQLTLQVSLPEMYIHAADMDDGNTYHVVTVEGSAMSDAGQPAVPLFGRWILIPNGTNTEIVVDPGPPEILEGIQLQPAQLPLLNLEDALPPPFTKNEEIYATDADYPGVFARLEQTKIMRGQEMTVLWLYPYQYNPVQETLYSYPNLNVTVQFIGNLEPIPAGLKSETYDDMMRNLAINADAILSAEEEAGPPVDPHPFIGPYGWDYLIFTHPQFATAANKLAAWKNKMGFKTLVTQIPPKWKASDIKNAIQGAYDNWDVAPKYVLLIGDAEYVPTHYKTLHPYESMAGGKGTQGYTATDLYYVTLQGNDYVPDIAIGRLSVDTAEEADDRVDGIINYEKNPVTDSSFYNTVTIAAYFQDGVSGGWSPDGIADSRFAQTSEDLALFFSKPQYNINKTVKRVYYTKSNVTPTKWNNNQFVALNNFGGGPAGNAGAPIPAHLKKPVFAWDGDYQDITNAVQAGTFLLTHRDHGGRRKWSHPYYGWADAFLLQNPSLLPVVWSVNCQTGWFDNETDFKKKPGIKDSTQNWEEAFSEYWERPAWRPYGDYGAVGIIAATRVTDSIYNDRLMWGWTDAIWPDFPITPAVGIQGGAILHMGDVLNYGKSYMSTQVPDNVWRKAHFETYHWFGDPSMEIRTETPPLMLATKP
ncbi:MAG: C25 family cysteine peptidase, partial [Anaerolineae bacterium]